MVPHYLWKVVHGLTPLMFSTLNPLLNDFHYYLIIEEKHLTDWIWESGFSTLIHLSTIWLSFFALNTYWCFIRFLWIEIEFQCKVLCLANVIIFRKQTGEIAVRKRNLRKQTSWVSLRSYIHHPCDSGNGELRVRNPTLNFGKLITLYFLGSKNKQSVFLGHYMTLPIGIGQCD